MKRLGEEFELFVPCLLVTVTIPRAPAEPLPTALARSQTDFGSLANTYHNIRNNQNRQPHIIRHITPLPEPCYGTNPVFSVDEAEAAAFTCGGAAFALLRKRW